MSEENEDNDSEESNFETHVNNLVKEVQEYNTLANEDKIQNVDKFNSIMETISQYDTMLQNYKDRLVEIDTKSIKKKSAYVKKNFVTDMEKIMSIKNEIELNRSTIDQLLDLYSEFSIIQQRIIPYLENKKLEIIKL